MVPCLRRGEGGDGVVPWDGGRALEMVVNGDGVIGWFGLHPLKELSKSDQTESTGLTKSVTHNESNLFSNRTKSIEFERFGQFIGLAVICSSLAKTHQHPTPIAINPSYKSLSLGWLNYLSRMAELIFRWLSNRCK